MQEVHNIEGLGLQPKLFRAVHSPGTVQFRYTDHFDESKFLPMLRYWRRANIVVSVTSTGTQRMSAHFLQKRSR